MLRGIDWGSYLSAVKGSEIPFKDLHDAGLLDFFVTKGCQEADYYSSTKNIQWAREAGCQAVGAYYWHYPTWTPDYQVQVYGDAIRAEKPDFIALDMEDAYGRSDWEVTTNAEAVCTGLTAEFPELPFFIYTSADYINTHCPTFNRTIGKYKRWIACWPGVIQAGMARYLSFDEIKAYPLPGWAARLPNGWTGWDIWQDVTWPIPEGYGWPFDHQYDWNVCNLTIEELKGKETQKMTALYNTKVAQADRAKVVTYLAAQTLTVTPDKLGVDAAIIPMGGMDKWDGSHMQLYTETSFKGRFGLFNSAGVPVIGRFMLDAGYWLKEQHTANEVTAQSAGSNMTDEQKVVSIRANLVLPKLFDAWSDGNWTWDGIFAKTVKWLPLTALELGMVGTEGWNGAAVTDYWQTLTFNHVANCLSYLTIKGYLPNIPLVLYTGPWWLSMFMNDFAIMLQNRKTSLYLHLGQWTLGSTATFKTLAELFTFRPADTFKFAYVPDNYFERILMHEISAETQNCDQMPGAKVALSLGNDTVAGLGWKATEPPPVVVVPPVTGDALTLAQLQTELATFKAELLAAVKADSEANRRIIMQEVLFISELLTKHFK